MMPGSLFNRSFLILTLNFPYMLALFCLFFFLLPLVVMCTYYDRPWWMLPERLGQMLFLMAAQGKEMIDPLPFEQIAEH